MSSPAATAHADQMDAATRTARTALHRLARATHSPLGTDPPRWVRTHISALQLAVVEGRANYCPHLPAAPSVLHAAVWAPGRVVCTACVPTLLPAGVEDITCDRCRRQAVPMHPGVTAFGPLILTYGICTSCKTTTEKENR